MLVKREPKDTEKRKRKDPREGLFYHAFLSVSSPTRGQGEESAISAGYDSSKAKALSERLIDALNKQSFKKVLEYAGLTKEKIARQLVDAINNSGAKEFPTNIRIALALMGENIGQQQSSSQTVIAGQGAQILVVAGATAERMNALKRGEPPRIAPKEPDVPKD